MLLATALERVDLHIPFLDTVWDLDLLPTPPQVVMGSLGQLDLLGQGEHEKLLDRLHLYPLPAQMLLWDVRKGSRNSLVPRDVRGKSRNTASCLLER